VRGDARDDIVLVETFLALNIDRIRSADGDVSLTTLVRGDINDFFDDAAADVIGVNLFFFATNGRIGATDNDLDIDSSTVRPGRLVAQANVEHLRDRDRRGAQRAARHLARGRPSA
jgi:hypothetical protein